MYIPDNLDAYEAHERAQAREERKYPKCAECGEVIYQDNAVRVCGNWICDNCLKFCREDIADDYI